MPNPSTNLQVISGEGMNVIVLPGFAMVDGCMSLEEDNRTLSLQSSDSQYDRIDTVVLRLNANDSYRLCDLFVVEGVPSINPIRPDLTREGDIYELGLADIFISKNSSVLSDSKITDTRYEADRCGVISSISEFDTETLNAQMNQWALEEREKILAWENEQQTDFTEWVEYLKTVLDESTAGHLQAEIDDLKKPATNETLGLVKGNGVNTSIDENGAIIVAQATNEILGLIKGNGTTTSINANGELDVAIATNSKVGLVKGNGTTVNIAADGQINLNIPNATTAATGLVKADGTTTKVDTDGTIHAVDTYPSVVNTVTGDTTALNTSNSIQASTVDLTAGTSNLETGHIYLVYEE